MPDTPDRARRRGLLSRSASSSAPPDPPTTDPRIEATIAAYQEVVSAQLADGLHAIQRTAYALMHEVAGEVWRVAGGSKDEAQARILGAIARDQAIGGLIASNDERFQSLAMRTERIEETVNALVDANRQSRALIEQGIEELRGAAASPAIDIEQLRTQLEEVTRQIATAFAALADRDRAIAEVVQRQVSEHGAAIAQETTGIAQAMQAYVQEGVSALGQLASSIDSQVSGLSARDSDAEARLSSVVEEQMRLLGEQLQLMYDRMSIHADSLEGELGNLIDRNDDRTHYLAEHLMLMHDRIGMEARDQIAALQALEARTRETLAGSAAAVDERIGRIEGSLTDGLERIEDAGRTAAIRSAQEIHGVLDARVMGLAQLVRSDSQALRDELVRTAAAHDRNLAERLDAELARVSEALTSATRWMVEEMSRRYHEETGRAIAATLGETAEDMRARIDETTSGLRTTIDGRLADVEATIDRNMVRMGETLDTELDKLGRVVGQQAAEAVERAMGERLDDALSRADSTLAAADRIGIQVDRLITESVQAQAETRQALEGTLDHRVTALARMIRSDNQAMAEHLRLAADQDAAKQAVRSVKELQANLPAEVNQIVERRIHDVQEQMHRDAQESAELIAKATEMLASRIDRMADQIADRYDGEIQTVVGRMGDAMQALAGLGRPRRTDRIELE